MTPPPDPAPLSLRRRLGAELVGTALLVAVVVGSGIMAQRLTADVGLQLLANALATVFALAVLIVVFGPVSGAHLNPVVTGAEWALSRGTATQRSRRDVAGYVLAQCTGGILGALLANAMFEVAPAIATTERAGPGLLVGEVVATAGLVLLIFALVRSNRAALVPAAVAAWIGAAYWFTSSTSFANPAVTVGRMFSDTFAGIAPGSVPPFLLAQVLGAGLGAAAALAFYPRPGTARTTVAEQHDPVHAGTHPHDRSTPMTTILFVCVHNAGRSQLAAGLAAARAGSDVTVLSAGTDPDAAVSETVLASLAEVGIDRSSEVPRLLTPEIARQADVLVALKPDLDLPAHERIEVWPLPDPATWDVDGIRPLRDHIDTLVADLVQRERTPR
ncbi:aquaporin [Cellulomonas terrae]|uniref:Phosphotyrosine protein phosphatase I domain-containing protein n=1 Tax=Cellulomonas terrae TaxID=311234 RepID=A0A511JPC4_9CELL|nr:aquaporin [Cellulomonas terrae]GEL99789.1 hypothetical protein CTE05_33360 [Cellulomonas terrae]